MLNQLFNFLLSDFEKLHFIEVEGVRYFEWNALGEELFIAVASGYAVTFIASAFLDLSLVFLVWLFCRALRKNMQQ